MKKIIIVLISSVLLLTSCQSNPSSTSNGSYIQVGIVGSLEKIGFAKFGKDISASIKQVDSSLSTDYNFQKFETEDLIKPLLEKQELDFAVVSPETAAYVWNKTKGGYKIIALTKSNDIPNDEAKDVDNKNYKVSIVKTALNKAHPFRYTDFIQNYITSKLENNTPVDLGEEMIKRLKDFYKKDFEKNKDLLGGKLPDSTIYN